MEHSLVETTTRSLALRAKPRWRVTVDTTEEEEEGEGEAVPLTEVDGDSTVEARGR